MILRGVDFGKVWGASGVQGFFGEGYWFHRWFHPFGLDFEGATFVAKTTTLHERQGNMPLRPDFTPQELYPRCIKVYLPEGYALNAVGLSGPGAKALLSTGRWQSRKSPFFISFMAVEDAADKRLDELQDFVELLRDYLPGFQAPVGLQLNYSCPNTGHQLNELVGEVKEGLAIASSLGIPLVPKFNTVLPVRMAIAISNHPHCDGLCVSNAIPWAQLKQAGIDPERVFGTGVSPLAEFGGGGFSGAYLFPALLQWLYEARRGGVRKPINAGGGILSLRSAQEARNAGAASIFLGSIAFLRPWRVRGIIRAMRR